MRARKISFNINKLTESLIWLFIIIILKHNEFFTPPVWDAAMGIFPPAVFLSEHHFSLLELSKEPNWWAGGANVHSTSIMTWLLALLYYFIDNAKIVFWIMHLITFICTALSLTFFRAVLIKLCIPYSTAVLCCIAILSTPIILVQVGYIYTEIPTLLFTILAIYFYANNKLHYAILAVFIGLMIKLTAVAILCSLCFVIALTGFGNIFANSSYDNKAANIGRCLYWSPIMLITWFLLGQSYFLITILLVLVLLSVLIANYDSKYKSKFYGFVKWIYHLLFKLRYPLIVSFICYVFSYSLSTSISLLLPAIIAVITGNLWFPIILTSLYLLSNYYLISILLTLFLMVALIYYSRKYRLSYFVVVKLLYKNVILIVFSPLIFCTLCYVIIPTEVGIFNLIFFGILILIIGYYVLITIKPINLVAIITMVLFLIALLVISKSVASAGGEEFIAPKQLILRYVYILRTIPDVLYMFYLYIFSSIIFMLLKYNDYKRKEHIDFEFYISILILFLPLFFIICSIANAFFISTTLLPRYLVPIIPALFVPILLLTVRLRIRFIGAIFLISYIIFSIANYNGKYYVPDYNSFSIVERSHAYKNFLDVQMQAASAVDRLDSDATILVSRDMGYFLSNPKLGYVNKKFSNIVLAFNFSFDELKSKALKSKTFYILISNVFHGGQELIKLTNDLKHNPNYSVVETRFNNSKFTARLYKVTSK